MLRALAGHARGAVALADDDARGALVALRRAWKLWQELEAPYEGARARVLLARACSTLGDDETAALELEAARAVFERLGAAPDLARVDSLTRAAVSSDSRGLSGRELQVLRLVATGMSNKAIAAELVLSKRTVDRHVSNIFAKLRVSTRAAATAFAYEHELDLTRLWVEVPTPPAGGSWVVRPKRIAPAQGRFRGRQPTRRMT